MSTCQKCSDNQEACLADGVLHQELEFLVPDGRAMAAGVAGVVVAAAAEGLVAHL